MIPEEAIQLLEEKKSKRGISNWIRLESPEVKSYGLGVTQIKSLAK
ncbi:MAG: hypothetical protein HN600_17850 [Bacteroidetes bacterium]|jgi:hypothetical protein|nr:hypothetical protein [Bacteroidota bacterium]